MKKIMILLATSVLAACASDSEPHSSTTSLQQQAQSLCQQSYAHMNAGFERDKKINTCIQNRLRGSR